MHTLEELNSGKLKGSTQIKLSCGLTTFPSELFSLAESIEVMDLSGNSLSSLPADFARFTKLRIVFFSDNLFTELPSVLGQCKQLSMIGFKSNRIEYIPEDALPETTRWLILTNNKLDKIPASIGKCHLLQKVALAGNRLRELPPEMAYCRNIELLRISANELESLPDWLLQLPKLSWLAFAGNPFSRVKKEYHLDPVSWNEFEVLEQLGEGASGNIYRALWLKNEGVKEIAVKVFKGEVTSDGFPDDEMQACVAAESHPNLVSLLAEIKEHPQQKQGLVMELIPSHFYNLGLPPSLSTCTRDTFKEDTLFSSEQILKIAIGIASAAVQLHAKGIMHGDLYAHNVLVDNSGNALMGDFGAASFYEVHGLQAKKIQQIECRAFGCLLEDLLLHSSLQNITQPLIQSLFTLKQELMQETGEKRPLFNEVLFRLKELDLPTN